MHFIDTFVQKYILFAHSPVLTEWMFVFTSFFDASVYTVVVFFLITLLIAIVRSKQHAALFACMMIFASFLVYILKITLDVARPLDGFMDAFGSSFPSFHATMATVFFISIMYIFDSELNPYLRVAFDSVSILGLFTIAFSRVYLGVHWVSDVIAGVILGALIGYLSVLIFERVIHRPLSASMIK